MEKPKEMLQELISLFVKKKGCMPSTVSIEENSHVLDSSSLSTDQEKTSQ